MQAKRIPAMTTSPSAKHADVIVCLTARGPARPRPCIERTVRGILQRAPFNRAEPRSLLPAEGWAAAPARTARPNRRRQPSKHRSSSRWTPAVVLVITPVSRVLRNVYKAQRYGELCGPHNDARRETCQGPGQTNAPLPSAQYCREKKKKPLLAHSINCAAQLSSRLSATRTVKRGAGPPCLSATKRGENEVRQRQVQKKGAANHRDAKASRSRMVVAPW